MPDPQSAPPSWSPAFPPQAAFAGAPVYSGGGEALVLSVMNFAAGVTLALRGRTIAFGDAQASPFEVSLTPATDRSVSTVRVPLPAGWLLSAQVVVTAGTPQTSQTFCRLSLQRGVQGIGADVWTLCAGSATTKKPLSYPGSLVLDSLAEEGALRSITGTNPGAGVELSETVSTGARWNLIAFRALFTASGSAGNRFPAFVFDDGANIYGHATVNATIAAGGSCTISLQEGIGLQAAGQPNFAQASLPANNRFGSGHRIRTSTAGILAGDTWTSIQYLVRDRSEGN